MIVPGFDIGDRVRIVPIDRIEARVIAIEKDRDGWAIVCRYFENGDAKTVKLFEDELERRP